MGSCVNGMPLSMKVNVNLGVSDDLADKTTEWEKVEIVLRLGAHAIMYLSNSGDTRAFRTRLIAASRALVGAVPLYDAVAHREKPLPHLTAQDFLDAVRRPPACR